MTSGTNKKVAIIRTERGLAITFLFSANATNVIKSSYLIPIHLFNSWRYSSILSKELVIINIHKPRLL